MVGADLFKRHRTSLYPIFFYHYSLILGISEKVPSKAGSWTNTNQKCGPDWTAMPRELPTDQVGGQSSEWELNGTIHRTSEWGRNYEQSEFKVASRVRNPAWKNRENLVHADSFSRVKGRLSLSTSSDTQICKSDSLLRLYRDWEEKGQRRGQECARWENPSPTQEVFSTANIETSCLPATWLLPSLPTVMPVEHTVNFCFSLLSFL